MTTQRFRVAKGCAWDVAAPGGRQWTGAPSQTAAFNLAQSLAAIDTMLGSIARPKLTVVGQPRQTSGYGCYRVPSKASS